MKTSTDEPAKDEDDREDLFETAVLGPARRALLSSLGSAVTLSGARDVQAAINAAGADLPSSLRSNPTYHKVNPADSPVLVLALTSQTRAAALLYDVANTVIQQKLAQIGGIGRVTSACAIEHLSVRQGGTAS
jgi:multidrug efflux pump